MLFSLAGAGCAGTYGYDMIYGYDAMPAEIVPPAIEAYPHTYYRGSYAYLVGNHWYYPTQRGWMVFRQEPRELARYRTRIAPAAPMRPHALPPPGYAYPPEAPRREYIVP